MSSINQKVSVGEAKVGDIVYNGKNAFRVLDIGMKCVGTHPILRFDFSEMELKFLDLTPGELRELKVSIYTPGQVVLDYFGRRHFRILGQDGVDRMNATGKLEYMAFYLGRQAEKKPTRVIISHFIEKFYI